MISDYDISKYLPSTKQNVSMARNTWSPNLWARVSSIVHTPMDTKDTCNTYFYNYKKYITTKETCCSTILLPFLLTAGRSARRPDPSLPRPELTPMHMISWLAFSPFLTSSSSRGISLANWG